MFSYLEPDTHFLGCCRRRATVHTVVPAASVAAHHARARPRRLSRVACSTLLALLGLGRLERRDQVGQLLLLRLEVDHLLRPLIIERLLLLFPIQQPLARVLELAHHLLEPG